MSEMFIPDVYGFTWSNRSRPLVGWDDAVIAEKWLRSGRPSPQVYLDALKAGLPWARMLRIYGRAMDVSYFAAKHPNMKQRKCYRNALQHRLYRLNEGEDHFAYAEGLYMGFHTPILHAWNMLGEYVADGTFGPDRYAKYYGVVFSVDFLRFLEFVLGPRKWQADYGIWKHIAHTGPYVQNYCRLRHFA